MASIIHRIRDFGNLFRETYLSTDGGKMQLVLLSAVLASNFPSYRRCIERWHHGTFGRITGREGDSQRMQGLYKGWGGDQCVCEEFWSGVQKGSRARVGNIWLCWCGPSLLFQWAKIHPRLRDFFWLIYSSWIAGAVWYVPKLTSSTSQNNRISSIAAFGMYYL